MKNFVGFDCETTILNHGNPWTKSNKLCVVAIQDEEGATLYKIEYDDEPCGHALKEIKRRIEKAYLLIGFNVKFDLSWIRRYIPDLYIPRVYDCQLSEFILNNQISPYPSLEEACTNRGIPGKYDIVRVEYWDRGIDTLQVPLDILGEYCLHDVDITMQLFHKQKVLFEGPMKRLFLLQCEDLLGLQKAEQNGLLYDFKQAKQKGTKLQEEIQEIDAKLRSLSGIDWLNFGSSDQLSALLYGGVVYERYREPTIRILKSGEEKHGERWGERPIVFRQLVNPLAGTESDGTSKLSESELREVNTGRVAEGKKPLARVYSTAAPVLTHVRAKGLGKNIIQLLLSRATKSKMDSTYYTGLVDLHDRMEWQGDEIHGQFNTCVAQTGRLSSSGPNLQNMDGGIKDLFYSRYE